MSISVVGFDVGSLTSYIACTRGGGIEILANEYSERCTPTCVSFNKSSRFIGTAAEQQSIANIKNTPIYFTRFLGKQFNDPVVAKEQSYILNKIQCGPYGRAGFEMEIDGVKQILLPEQIMAMQLSKLRKLSEDALSCRVVDVVLNVPTYFTDCERRAVLDASRIAGLNCMRIVNDTTAIGIGYGIYNKDLPSPEEPPRNVVFVNLGHSSLQVSITAFNKGKMKVISTACNPFIGGRDFDLVIFNQMVKEIKEKYNVNVMKSEKAQIRLIKSCEKLKKVMSTNATKIPLHIECLMNDIDVVLSMDRELFETLCIDYLKAIKETINKAVISAKIETKNIFCVELVGGGTRIPAVKQLIVDIFGQEGRTTLNQDEAVARGCALQAAICSPAFKVKEFNITDACPYSVSVYWEPSEETNELSQGTHEEVYPYLCSIPSSKKLVFERRSDFVLKAGYSSGQALHIACPDICSFKINVVPPTLEEICQIRVKVRINSNGIFEVTNVAIAEKVEKEVEVPIEQPKVAPQPNKTTPTKKDAEGDSQSNPSENCSVNNENSNPPLVNSDNTLPTAPVQSPSKPKTQLVKKTVIKYRDIPINSYVTQLSQLPLMELIEFEVQLSQKDKLERERHDLKNSIEEHVYDYRSKLDGSLREFLTFTEYDSFTDQLSKIEDWVYTDGETANRSKLSDQLKSLTDIGNVYLNRMSEYHSRPAVIEEFRVAAMHIRQVLENYHQGKSAFEHLGQEEMKNVEKCLIEKEEWLKSIMNSISLQQKTENPKVTTQQILTEKTLLENQCNPIVFKPKPVPPPPATPEVKDNKNEKPQSKSEDVKKNVSKSNGINSTNECGSADMEID